MQLEGLLFQLHAEIDARVQAIRADRPDWQCAKGCGACCRQLADVPRLSAAEWDLLRDGLMALSAERVRAVVGDVAALARQRSRPLTCPLLDRHSDACMVYAYRPVACRSYGFYVQRGLGLYCSDIENLVAGGELSEVVWGNHDGVDGQLACLGETRSLVEWVESWASGGDAGGRD